jgi:hypothetical protein
MKKLISAAAAITLSLPIFFFPFAGNAPEKSAVASEAMTELQDDSVATHTVNGNEQIVETETAYEKFYNALHDTKNTAELKALYGKATSEAEKIEIINYAGHTAMWPPEGVNKSEPTAWLRSLSNSEKDVSLRQAALYNLYNLGDGNAGYRLVQDVEKNGMAFSFGFRGGLVDWEFLKEVTNKYPGSYLARGIAAYEKVRGQSYFLNERGKNKEDPYSWIMEMQYGDSQYDPGREIPGWVKFLEEFPRHPAADDAAYRLARCYEITGQYANALNALEKALNSPDGDIRYHVAGRMVYVPDVRMTEAQLEEIAAGKIDAEMQLLVDYTLAVKALRQDDYARAAALLEEYVNRLDALPADGEISPFVQLGSFFDEQYGFKDEVKKQLEQVRVLAGLQDKWQKSKKPEDLYALAAAIYSNQMTYYNHLWAGNRQYFNWQGYISWQGYIYSGSDKAIYPAELASFAREMINYNHSAEMFKKVYDSQAASSDLKAKALFSQGLSFFGIYDWGDDANAAFERKALKKQVIDTFDRFVEEFPDNSMADDALLALASASGDKSYLDKIFEDYPRGDALERAKALLTEMSSPYYQHPE